MRVLGRALTRSVLVGMGFGLGIVASLALAVTVGTVKNWTTGETLTAADLNSTITSLKTALEAIPNWTKSGTAAVYTDGNVGIGTTSPDGILVVHDTTFGSTKKGIQVEHQSESAPWLRVTDPTPSTTYGWNHYHSSDNGDYYIKRLVAGTESEVIRFQRSSGNVGIGTTSPQSPGGNVRFLDIRSPGDCAGCGGGIGFGLANSKKADFYSYGNHMYIEVMTGGDLILQETDGNVGIGTATPGYPLTMASGAYVTTGGAWTNASSREFKENLRDLTAEEALAAVMALEPQKFNYKADCIPGSVRFHTGRSGRSSPDVKSGATSPSRAHDSCRVPPEQYVGFIAEDVPALVATNDRKGLSSMDLVAVLTKVVQEQQRQIEELRERFEKDER